MLVPKPRGSFSAAVFESLRRWPDRPVPLPAVVDDADDAAIALWALYELSYLGFDDVDDDLERDTFTLAVRRQLETDLEETLRSRYRPPDRTEPLGDALLAYVDAHDGASLAAYVQKAASADQVLDLLRMRSIYHLKEADPSAWAVARLPVPAKAALVELLYDEYGTGDPNQLHAHLFAKGMTAAGLRPEYGAYVDEVPVEILEQNNAMSLFGLHRRWRGAAMGHLAAFEATSSVPSRRMAQGLERLGFAAELVGYYTEHVEADAVHEQLAARNICGTLVEAEPALADDVFFGAFTCLDLEDRVATRLLTQWDAA
jgi:hypothetical protein